jgi:predicted 3-demethylubiquinone-9 3-methyltransferase (glyoxalase superfamily)
MNNGRTQKVRPFLWFNDQAEEAATFYTSIFKNAKIGYVSRYTDEGPGPKGQAMVVTFEIEGVQFMALNGGPEYQFTPAVSFMVDCKTQDEVDYFWDRLSEGGETVQCGWLRDKFGLSWQIVPERLGELMSDDDEEKAARVMAAMLKMTKLDIAALERAYAGD